MKVLALGSMAVLAAAGTALALVLTGQGSGGITLTKVSETNNTITFSYNLIPNAVGYRYSSSAMSKFSHTWDPTKSTVKFSKTNSYKVEALGVLDDGVYPPTTTTTETTTTTTTTPPPPANLYITTTGSDSADCSQATPCKTWNRPYQMASCGNSISIAGGTYAEQKLLERGSCAGNPITIKGPANAFTPRFRFGSVVGGFSNDAPDDLVIDGLHVAGYILQGDATNITIKNTDGGAFFLQGAQNIQILDSDWGRCSSPATPNHPADDCLGSFGYQQSRIVDNGTGANETKNILIQGSVFHDHVATDPDHWEALWTNGGTDVTWRGNRIYNNSNTAAIWFDTPGLVRGTWVFENNWFGKENNGSAIGIARLPFTGTVIVRFNSFAAGEGVMNQGGGTNDASGRLNVVGNIIGQHSCIAGANYSYNVTLGSSTCAGTGNVNVSSLPYVDGSNGASGNYHLSATTVADNHVPVGAANSETTTDYDGQARPIGALKDAGSDER